MCVQFLYTLIDISVTLSMIKYVATSIPILKTNLLVQITFYIILLIYFVHYLETVFEDAKRGESKDSALFITYS